MAIGHTVEGIAKKRRIEFVSCPQTAGNLVDVDPRPWPVQTVKEDAPLSRG
jgi:hypothetical protein